MKKLLALLTIMSLLCTGAYASGITMLYEEDFENTGVLTAKEYMAQSDNIEEPTVTNHGLKSIDFSKESGSNALKFTGYTNVEQPNHANKTVNFVFDEPYTLESFPDTKLVVSFVEYITKADDRSYTHTVISGGGKTIMQMFWAETVGEGPTYRGNNNGAIGKKADLNKRLESTYIFDLSTHTFDFIFDGTEYSNKDFNSGGADATQIDKISFNIAKEHIFSVDDIKVYAMPKDEAFVVSDPKFDGDENVSVDSDFTAKLSAYAKNTEAISITANDTAVDSNAYTISQKYVNEDGGYVLMTIDFKENLEYLTNYKVTFGAELSNIIGTAITEPKAFTFKTEKEARAYIDSVECYAGFMNGTERFTTLAEARNKYVTFNIDVSKDFTTEKKVVIFVESTDADGNIIDRGFANTKFVSESENLKYSTYISDDVSSVKIYVKDSLKNGKTMSDITLFE